MSLTAVKTALVTQITNTVTGLTGGVHASPPNTKPTPWSAYIWPAGPWVAVPTEQRTMCPQADVTMVVDLLAGTEDYIASQTWFDERLTELWVGAAGGIAVEDDEISPVNSDPPVIVAAHIGAASFLRVRTTFSPYRWDIS